MQLELSPQSIPNFLSAETPQGLRRAMLRNNARMGAFVRYFDIGQIVLRGRPVFIAWFYDRIENDAQFSALLTDDVAVQK